MRKVGTERGECPACGVETRGDVFERERGIFGWVCPECAEVGDPLEVRGND